jgi:hypothetical protein
MNRTLSRLGPNLWMAVVLVVATSLVVAAPHAPWTAVAGPLLLVLALLGADLVHRRRAGLRTLPSPGALLVAAAILVACGLVAARGLDRLAGMMPILGSCAALPVVLRHHGARLSCRRA